jgi:hypothetical protein
MLFPGISWPARKLWHLRSRTALPLRRQPPHRLAVECLEQRVCPSILYDFDLIAQTGQNGLTAFGQGASINEAGHVAFLGLSVFGGQALYMGNGATLTPITPTAPEPNYFSTIQINNHDQVAAVQQDQGHSQVRIWNAEVADPGAATIAVAGGFQAILPAVSLNDAGDLVFAGFDGSGISLLEQSRSLEQVPLAKLETPQPFLRPLFSDSGSVVLQDHALTAQPQQTAPIEVLKSSAADPTVASVAMGFSTLGSSPGISRDGNLVAFYGVLTDTGAEALHTYPGPGIFVSQLTSGGWSVPSRVAGAQDGIQSFDPNSRVGVAAGTSKGPDGGSVPLTIVYLGFDQPGQQGNEGLYITQLAVNQNPQPAEPFIPTTDLLANAATPVYLGNSSTPVTLKRFALYDPISTNGQIAFWAAAGDGTQEIIRAKPARTPVLLVPGIGTTLPKADFANWLVHRGVSPDRLQLDPLHTYDDLLQTLKNTGYAEGRDLFIATYDWRMPLAELNPADGSLLPITASGVNAHIENGQFRSGVDYLVYWLEQAQLAWSKRFPNAVLPAVDVIAHSTGGLITRAYIQSGAYNGLLNDRNINLPTIRSFVMIGVPNQGASKAWNPLHDNFNYDPFYALFFSGVFKLAYFAETGHGDTPGVPITGIDYTISGVTDPTTFISLYAPGIRSLLATYDFLCPLDGSRCTNVNTSVAERNDLVLDLNRGLDFSTAQGAGPYAKIRVSDIFGTSEWTPTYVAESKGPDDPNQPPEKGIVPIESGNRFGSPDSFFRRPGPDETWYRDVQIPVNGDGTVPLQSSRGLFPDHGIVPLFPFAQRTGGNPAGNTSDDVDHNGLLYNRDVQAKVLDLLGHPLQCNNDVYHCKDVSYQLSLIVELQNLKSFFDRLASLTVEEIIKSFFASFLRDPVEGFLVDGEGHRLGYSKATGVLTEIPGSVYLGDAEGIGWVFGPVAAPVTLQLSGVGQSYFVDVNGEDGGVEFGTTSGGFLAVGATVQVAVPLPPSVTTDPTNQIVAAGTSVSFIATASGNPVPTVQWEVSTDGGITFSSVTGATSTSLTFTAGAGQSGNRYRAIFTNSAGSATTTAAVLTVATSPIVTTNPTSQVVSAGNPVSLVAAAVGSPTPTVQWQVSADGGNSFTDIAGATATTFTFTASASQSPNAYRAAFTNASGNAYSTPAFVTVNTTPGNLVISAPQGVFPRFHFDDPGFSSDFPLEVVPLSTGNIVMTDLDAVYLFNGQTGVLISALTGTGRGTVTALANGNFVVISNSPATAGAVTWGSGTTGVSGVVSAANSLVGITQGGSSRPTITPLTNGNYVVSNPGWHNARGAVTWASGTAPIVGTVSAANSLVGANATNGNIVGDQLGSGVNFNGGVIALPNGNFVVVSPLWNDRRGAVTWAIGTGPITGTVSADNSLVGTNGTIGNNPGDEIGMNGVTALTNGNYVVASPLWNGEAGAATWGDGSKGISGTVSADNSLVGSTSSHPVGSDVTALTNGNYVVSSPFWSPPSSPGDLMGAVTWGNGTTGIAGTVTADNSLVGSHRGDEVGLARTSSFDPLKGVVALANGNYVVNSTYWNGGTYAGVGAVTWGNGTRGVVGTVSPDNSIVGSHTGNNVSDHVGNGGVTALANGNYAVASPDWQGGPFNGLGAVTWGSGTGGVAGQVSSDNSLVGSEGRERVGSGGVTALANGNYVVASPGWNFGQGAATWASGSAGVKGTISPANSLVGRDSSTDQVGNGGIAALANGNYVVLSTNWNGGKGAATWVSGATAATGVVSAANSLTGLATTTNGGPFRVRALPNGDYVVIDPTQSSATWGDGTTGATLDGRRTPTSQNILSGGGSQAIDVSPLGTGNPFLFISQGTLDEHVPSSATAFTDPNLLTYTLGEGQTITVTPDFLTRTLNAGINVTIQSNDDIVINSPIIETPSGTAGSLTLQAGRSIRINADINTAGGNLTLIANDTRADGVVDTERDPGDADIAEQSGATINTGTGTLTVDLKDGTDKTNHGRGGVTLPQVTGSETLSSASTVRIAIHGMTPGDGITAGSYTEFHVTGSLNLNGAALAVTYGASTAIGTTFTIVQTSAGVSDTFAGLSEGAMVTASDGVQFRISYQGNGGKDVVLTQLTQPPVIPTQLVVTTQPPNPIQASSRFGLIVKAEDDSGNVATTFTGSVTVALADNPGGSTLGGMLTVSAINGEASFSGLTLDQPSFDYTLQVTGGGLTGATTTPFDVQPAVVPTQLAVTTQPPGSFAAGAAFGLIVMAEDSSGNAATSFTGNVTVALANNPGGGTLGGMLTVPAVNGRAFFSGLTLNQAGTGYTLLVTGSGLNPAVTSAFNVTAIGGGGNNSGGTGGGPGTGSSARAITARLLTVKARKKKRLTVEVLFADTGALKREFASPFQKPAYKNVQVTVRDSNGDGIPDQVVVTAKKGKKTVTQVYPG